MRIALEPLLHNERQRAEPLAHVGVPGRKPYPSPARKRDHRQRSRADSAPITLANVAASGAPSIVMRTCWPKAIVIEDDGAGGGAQTARSRTPTRSGREKSSPAQTPP